MTFTDPLPRRRRPSLTPMIDVVFLLLVFFMLASRFGIDRVVDLPLAGAGGAVTGPPRLVGVAPDGLTLNGIATDLPGLVADLRRLLPDPTQPVVLRGTGAADLQRLVEVTAALNAAGFPSVVLVE